jgi:hypothetical protein
LVTLLIRIISYQPKWIYFLDGFRNIYYLLDWYSDGEWGYDEFWEGLNIGWYREYIFPYDDPYTYGSSFERKLRLAE